MYRTNLKRISLPQNRRVLVTSDIHGGRRQLRQVLKKADFSQEDILFIVGDYMERGPESLGVVRDVMELCKTHTVYPMIGNSDLARLNCMEKGDLVSCEDLWKVSDGLRRYYGTSMLWEMCGEAGLSPASPQELMECIPQLREQFKPELDFLRGLFTIIETEHYIFVHGGLPSGDLETFVGTDPFPYLKNDAFVNKGICFEKWLVVGHWPASLYWKDQYNFAPFVQQRQRILAIDGGCGVKSEGQLNLVELRPGGGAPLGLFAADILPKYRALDGQQACPGNAVVSWVTRRVERLEQKGGFSRLRHLDSGAVFLAPDCWLYEEPEGLCCRDYTDSLLEILPGDVFSMILSLPEGMLVKKDSRVGWYLGQAEALGDALEKERG